MMHRDDGMFDKVNALLSDASNATNIVAFTK